MEWTCWTGAPTPFVDYRIDQGTLGSSAARIVMTEGANDAITVTDPSGVTDTLIDIDTLIGTTLGDVFNLRGASAGRITLDGAEGNDRFIVGRAGGAGGLNGQASLSGGAGSDVFSLGSYFVNIDGGIGGTGNAVTVPALGLRSGSGDVLMTEGLTFATSSSLGVAVDLLSGRVTDRAAGGELFFGPGWAGRAQVTGIEVIVGTARADNIRGDDLPNLIYGVSSSGANLHGDRENLYGEDGHDTIYGGESFSYIEAGDGNDTVVVTATPGQPGTISSTARIIDGQGDDSYSVSNAYGTLSYEDATSGVTIDLSAGVVTGSGSGRDRFSGFELVSGTDFDDRVIVGASPQSTAVPGRGARLDAPHRQHGTPPGRYLPHGAGRHGRDRCRGSGARAFRATDRRRIDPPLHSHGQRQRPDHHGCRKTG